MKGQRIQINNFQKSAYSYYPGKYNYNTLETIQMYIIVK